MADIISSSKALKNMEDNWSSISIAIKNGKKKTGEYKEEAKKSIEYCKTESGIL